VQEEKEEGSTIIRASTSFCLHCTIGESRGANNGDGVEIKTPVATTAGATSILMPSALFGRSENGKLHKF
jgi:hypothetical protein